GARSRAGVLGRRARHRGGLGARCAGPVRRAEGPHPRSARSRGDGCGRTRGHPPRLDHGRPALTGVQADQGLRPRPAAASGVPDDADGLVHPPLSPVVDVVKDTGYDAENAVNLFAAIDELRIPIEYLANLFTAGDTDIVADVLRRMAAMSA